MILFVCLKISIEIECLTLQLVLRPPGLQETEVADDVLQGDLERVDVGRGRSRSSRRRGRRGLRRGAAAAAAQQGLGTF